MAVAVGILALLVVAVSASAGGSTVAGAAMAVGLRVTPPVMVGRGVGSTTVLVGVATGEAMVAVGTSVDRADEHAANRRGRIARSKRSDFMGSPQITNKQKLNEMQLLLIKTL
jgi:hypothetical protein